MTRRPAPALQLVRVCCSRRRSGGDGRTLTAVVDQLAQVMLKITGAIMALAPLAG